MRNSNTRLITKIVDHQGLYYVLDYNITIIIMVSSNSVTRKVGYWPTTAVENNELYIMLCTRRMRRKDGKSPKRACLNLRASDKSLQSKKYFEK